MNILPEYIKVILEAFASSLKRVTFSSCKKITLTDLMPCCQLESLSILGFSCLEKPEIAPARPPPNFLPQLKSFQSDYCPGLWSLWLEQISELTHLTLNCCHYGTKVIRHFLIIYFKNSANITFIFPKGQRPPTLLQHSNNLAQFGIVQTQTMCRADRIDVVQFCSTASQTERALSSRKCGQD